MSYCVKLEISFENPDGLEFIVFPESGGDKIKKIFGILKEIKIGNSDFDDRYLIRGNDEEKIVRLFSKPNIQEIMLNRFGLYLELTQKYLILTTICPFEILII